MGFRFVLSPNCPNSFPGHKVLFVIDYTNTSEKPTGSHELDHHAKDVEIATSNPTTQGVARQFVFHSLLRWPLLTSV